MLLPSRLPHVGAAIAIATALLLTLSLEASAQRILVMPSEPPDDVVQGGGPLPDYTANVSASGPTALDKFYSGDASNVGKSGSISVLESNGYVFWGHGGTSSAPQTKIVAMRLSDGAVGAFDVNGDFFVPANSSDEPAAGYYLHNSEELATLFHQGTGVGIVTNDNTVDADVHFVHVEPGTSVTTSVIVANKDGHNGGGNAAGSVVLAKTDASLTTWPNLYVSEDDGSTWRQVQTSTSYLAMSFARVFPFNGFLYVFTGYEHDEAGPTHPPAVMRIDPGAAEEIVTLWDDHLAYASWAHYEHGYPGLPEPVVTDVHDIYPADGGVYLNFDTHPDGPRSLGFTTDLSQNPTQIAGCTGDAPTEYFLDHYGSFDGRLYCWHESNETVYRYESGTDSWTPLVVVDPGFNPNRVEVGGKNGHIAFAGNEQIAGTTLAIPDMLALSDPPSGYPYDVAFQRTGRNATLVIDAGGTARAD